jgi:predicted PurR-regulated permease PerM
VRAASRTSPGGTIALWVVATIAIVFFLRSASQLLIPIVLAFLISYALEPVVAFLAQHRLPRPAASSVVLLLILGLGAWGVYTLRDDTVQLVEQLPGAVRRARGMLASNLQTGPAAKLQEAARELQPTGEVGSGSGSATQPAGTSGRQVEDDPSSPPSTGSAQASSGLSLGDLPGSLARVIQRGVGSLIALAGHLTVIGFLVFFLLISGHHFRERIVEIAGPDAEARRRAATIIDDINAQIQRFLLVRLVTSAIVGVATWAVLAWMQVEHAAVWGILAGVFNSIPYFGPVIVSGGLLLVGLMQGGGMTQALQMAGAALAITSLEGWQITPPLLGKAERMSVLAVFLGLLLWTWIWGAWGTILAVPMLVVVKSVADHVPRLKPIGRLLAP